MATNRKSFNKRILLGGKIGGRVEFSRWNNKLRPKAAVAGAAAADRQGAIGGAPLAASPIEQVVQKLVLARCRAHAVGDSSTVAAGLADAVVGRRRARVNCGRINDDVVA